MNAKQAKRSSRKAGKYQAQFARTRSNKERRVERLMKLFPRYRATLGIFKP